jgi:hypothetical protein
VRSFLLHCNSRAETAIANIFRDLDFPKFVTQRIQQGPRAAMQLCIARVRHRRTGSAKACYNNAQAVEIRVPLD